MFTHYYTSVSFELNNGMNNGGGFFSVFFFLCEAFIHAKKKGIPFYITHNTWPYTFSLGWHDYFTTLECLPLSSKNKSLKCGHMILHDNWKYTLHDFSKAAREIFIPLPSLQLRVQEIVDRLGNYTSIFVRRGDKVTQNESKYIHMRDILKNIPHDESTTFFVQTDDYTVIEELIAECPLNKVVTLVPPTKRGSWHSKQFRLAANCSHSLSLEEKPKEEVYKETEEMIVGLLVCLSANQCWTDDTSNVGRFLKLYNPNTVHVYPTDYTLDYTKPCHPAWTLF